MSGFWYSTAIAATASALFSLYHHLPSPVPTELVATKSPFSKQLTNRQTPDQQTFDRAMELANYAVAAYQSARKEINSAHSIALTQRERLLWQATLQTLERIPERSALYTQANEKQIQYQGLLANAERKLAGTTANFFAPILAPTLQQTGINPDQIHITLCQLDVVTPQPSVVAPSDTIDPQLCRHHQGDVQLASPASLIKLPIAIALMDKVTDEDINLETKIYIDSSNFTENAEGASIDIDEEYTLVQVVNRMIDQSNNIATNQLIDYIGRERIAQTLAERDYSHTLVDHKLAGDRILPPNAGTHSNQSTSNDLTSMMMDTYSLKHSGDEALLKALMGQKDRELGYQALSELGPDVLWLGEKTGQNNRLIGSMLAMEVKGDRYVLTVAIDHHASPATVRSLIKDTASRLLTKGSLVQTGGR